MTSPFRRALVSAMFATLAIATTAQAAALRAGIRLLDCGATDPEQTVTLAVRPAARSVRVLDAPLSGSSQQFHDSTAVMTIGGNREDCAALEPVLAAINSRRFLLGPPGSGSRAKLATNLLPGLNRAALAETLVFAERAGDFDNAAINDTLRQWPS
ncbi:MAG: NAD(P)-binding domain-containing protein [Betaproteobacteria bacterium]